MRQLTKNFTLEEFECKCGACTHLLLDLHLVEYLQFLRDSFETPIRVLSGARCPEHNANVGGSPRSRHLTRWGNTLIHADAADITFPDKGLEVDYLWRAAKWIDGTRNFQGTGGIGVYPVSGFIHLDFRLPKKRWYEVARGEYSPWLEQDMV